MTSNYLKITQTATLWLIVLACISINLPTKIMSITNILLIIFWFISGKLKDKIKIITENPVSQITLGLIFIYSVGMIYASVPLSESFKGLMHYQKLLIIPIIISCLTEEKFKNYALNAFLFSSIASLAISYLKWGGIIPHTDTGEGYTAFKNRIAGSIIMSFSMYLMLLKAAHASGKIKYLWIFFALLAVGDVSFLMNGRTGQVLMLALFIWFSYEVWGNKCIKYWLASMLLGIAVLYSLPELPKSRLTDIQTELNNHNIDGQQTSAGLRIEFYKNSLLTIKNNILFGNGTGSFGHEYELIATQQNAITTNVANPHNQFLFTTEELGIIGLLILGLFFYIPWFISYKSNNDYQMQAIRGLVLTMVIGSLFNSLLFDTSEGKFYCILISLLLSTYKKPETTSIA